MTIGYVVLAVIPAIVEETFGRDLIRRGFAIYQVVTA